MTQQLEEIRGMLVAARAVLEQAYTMTTALAIPAMAEDACLGYETYQAEAKAALGEGEAKLARVAAQRAATTVQPLLVIDCNRPDWVYLCGQPVRLRPAEFRLLLALARSARKVVRYATLYDALWAGETIVEPGQMYAQCSRLRRKLEPNWPAHLGALLETVPRVGVRLNVAAHQLGVLEAEVESDVETLDGDCEIAELE